MTYSTRIANLNGQELDEVPARNLQYSYILNAPGSVSFVLPSRDKKCTMSLLYPGQREVHVYRDNQQVWGGYLWTASQSQDEVTFGGEGWHSRFRRIFIEQILQYLNTDQFDTAWNLYNYAIGRDPTHLTGFTRRVVPLSGVKRDRTYPDSQSVDSKPVGEAVEDFTALDQGFDFEITPDKQIVFYYPQRGQRIANSVFTLDKNIMGWSLGIDASNMATSVAAVGAPDIFTGVPITSIQADAAARADFGLLEKAISFSDVVQQSTLDAHAKETLRTSKVPTTTPQPSVVTTDPPFGAYTVGDSVYIDLQSGYANFQQWLRIVSMTVSISKEGREAVGLFFNQETGV